MVQAPLKLVRLLAIAWCAASPFAGSACASRKARPSETVSPAPRVPVTLHVSNANWSDIRIHIVRAGMWTRIGLVTSGNSAVFDIPPDLIGQGGGVTLVVSPVAGRTTFTTPLNGVMPGDVLELTVENLLQFSHLVVR